MAKHSDDIGYTTFTMTARSEILEAARELYLSEGPDGLTMRRLADRVGVTAGALYRHYDGKQDVLLDVVEEAQKTMLEYLTRALEGETPRERMALADRAHLDFALEKRRLYEVLYATPEVIGYDELPEDESARARAIRQFWRDRVAECMEAGLLEGGSPEEVGVTLWSHSHGLISLYHRGLVDLDEEAFRELYRTSRRRALLGPAGGALRRELVEGRDGEDDGGMEG